MLDELIQDLTKGGGSSIIFIFLILLLFSGGFGDGFGGGFGRIFDDNLLLIVLVLFLFGGF